MNKNTQDMPVIRKEKKANFPSYICLLIFISFSVSPEPFLSETDDRNYLNISIMFFVQLFFFLVKKININDILLLFFVIFVAISSLLHPQTSWTSTIYLFLFCSTYIMYSNIIRQMPMRLDIIKRITSIIIYLFFVVLLLQQISVLISIAPPLAGNYDFGTPFKLSSLSSEPSAAAITVGLLTYFYIEIINYRISNKQIKISFEKQEYFVLICGLWVLLTNGSSTGILMSSLIMMRILLKINKILFLLPLLIFITFYTIYDSASISRILNIINSIFYFDLESIIEADHSGSYRYIPALLLLSTFEPLTIGGLFGLGNTFVGNYLHTVMPGTPPGFVAGGFASILVQYGLIASLIFLQFLIKSCCRSKNIFDIIIIIIMLFSINGINSQLFWLSIMILSTNKIIYQGNE